MVSPFLRKVKTASGAMAVQIAVKEGRRDKVIEHLGSAHTQAELAALMEIGRRRIAPDQLALDLPSVPSAPPPASTGPANVGAVVASKPCCGTFCTGYIRAWGWVRRSVVIGPLSRWSWRA